ncbi:MAG: hypothetical protein WCT08_01295 [Patescibacteria group bacterium]|jgi:hypothetical protein
MLNFLPWYFRLLFRLFPRITANFLGRKMSGGIDFATLQKILEKTKCVDLIPLNTENDLGFQIILDSKVALFFSQDSDHFAYDGYEVGEYDKGEVTVLDHWQKEE